MYKLVCSYQTGDSFGNEDIDDELIHEFQTEEAAISAMNRLSEHYKWYEEKESSYTFRDKKNIPEPEWHKELDYDFQASYYLDDGTLFKDTMPYCGYFETLYKLEIKKPSHSIIF